MIWLVIVVAAGVVVAVAAFLRDLSRIAACAIELEDYD